MGSYYFEVKGSNLKDASIESEGYLFDVVIEYKVINEGPYLLEEPTTFIVERNTTGTYNIGAVEDKELD